MIIKVNSKHEYLLRDKKLYGTHMVDTLHGQKYVDRAVHVETVWRYSFYICKVLSFIYLEQQGGLLLNYYMYICFNSLLFI